jgi:hypothetical protein
MSTPPRRKTPERLTDEDLSQLVTRMHMHNDGCYGLYQPCDKHHAHDNSCGARPLICRMREEPEAPAMLAALAELRTRRALDLTDDQRAALRTARDVASDADILEWDSVAERERFLAALDKLIGGAP